MNGTVYALAYLLKSHRGLVFASLVLVVFSAAYPLYGAAVAQQLIKSQYAENILPGTVIFAAGAPNAVEVAAASQMLEMHIANNGLALLRGARISGTEGTTLIATLLWGSTNFTWRVHTDATTKFFKHDGEKGTLADIRAGDIVTINGSVETEASEPSLAAGFIRE